MNAKEIKTQNIENLGYKAGAGVRGKGTKIYLTSRYFKSIWGINENSSKELLKQIEKENVKLDELYVQSGSYLKDSDTVSFSFEENYTIAEEHFSLKELVRNNFKGLKSCHIYYKPKTVGYFPLSKYDTDKSDQLRMVEDFIRKFDGVEIYGEFEDTNWNYDCMEFSHINNDGDRYIGDYSQLHGNSYYTEDTDDCEYVDGRVYNWNETVLDDFWAFGPDEGGWLNEVDPNDTIAVYERKGKDWYIGYTLEEREFYISYENDLGNLVEEEEFYALVYQPNEDLKQKVVDIVKSWKNDVEVKSYIYNQFDFNIDNNERITDEDVANLLYEDTHDFRNEVIENIQKWDSSTIEDEFFEAYHKIVDKKTKVLDDKTIEVTYTPFELGSEKPYSKKFNHLKRMVRFGKILGFEVVHSSVGTSETKAYAIKKDEEEYHFDILYLIAKDVSGEQTLREAVEDMLEALEKRKIEMLAQKELFEKASHVFVGIEDSLNSGNCQFGTNEFIARNGIDTSKIGGIRGDELLKMEMSNFTKRTVIYALTHHNKKSA